MKLRTFWACTGCSRIYVSERWGLKHLTTAHDGCAYLDEFSPERQQRLIEGAAARAAARI
jgi:serine/threonine protein phosphatase PrpC